MPAWAIVTFVIGAYLLGSLPTGLLIARARGIDIRQVGSGNIGATNVGRALGRRWAVLVLIVDAFKGYAPLWLAGALFGARLGAAAAAGIGLAAVAGHIFSAFLRFQGGKGVATSFGAALGLVPLPALAAAGLYAVLLAAFRISSIGSLSAAAAFPALIWLLGPREPAYVAFALLAAGLVFLRHRDNLRRLARGQELKA